MFYPHFTRLRAVVWPMFTLRLAGDDLTRQEFFPAIAGVITRKFRLGSTLVKTPALLAT